MYKHILIATDGSELAGRALAHGLALAKEVKASVTVVTVTQLWSALDMAHKAREGNRDPLNQFEEMTRQNVAFFEKAMQKMFNPFGGMFGAKDEEESEDSRTKR